MAKPGITKDKLVEVAFDLIWDQGYGSVSVGDICERAGVNKGSFYHFFESKTDLVIAAHEHFWEVKRPEMDRIFSSQVPPLERIHLWCEWVYATQKERLEMHGHVCGCPYASVGTEVAGCDDRIRATSERLMARGLKYFENTIADAIREGLVSVTDPAQAAQRICCLITGIMVSAKVQNSLDVFKDLEPSILNQLGAKVPAVS